MIAPPFPPTARGSRPVDTWNVTGSPISSTSSHIGSKAGSLYSKFPHCFGP